MVAIAGAFVLAGSAYAAAPTAAQYRAQANAVCNADQKKLDALPHGITLAVYLEDAIAVTQSSLTALQKLHPPASLATLHAKVVANIRAGFPIVQRLLVRAKAGKLTAAQLGKDPALTANAKNEVSLWKQLGAKDCT
jgi:hypothetical protein